MGKSSVYEGKTFDEAVQKGLEDLRLQRAEAIVDIQKKVALLLGLSMPGDEAS